MFSWIVDIFSALLTTIYEGDFRALVALFLVSSLTEVGMPFPFVIDGILVVTSFEKGLLSASVGRLLVALLAGRLLGSAVIYVAGSVLGKAFVGLVGRRFPALARGFSRVIERIRCDSAVSVCIARLTPGLLTGSSVACGIGRVSYRKFAFGVVLSSLVADGVLVGLGFASRHGLEFFGVEPSAWMALVAATVVFGAIWLVRWWRRRMRERQRPFA